MNVLGVIGLAFIAAGLAEVFLRRRRLGAREIVRQLVLLFAITLGLVRMLVSSRIPPWMDGVIVMLYVVLVIGAMMARPAPEQRSAS